MLRVGILGVGGIAENAHIPAWMRLENTKVVALCDIRPERLELVAPKLPDAHTYTSFDDMMTAEKLDILDICLPSYLHAAYSIRALEAGVHVLCEKPVSLCEEDVTRIYAAAEKANRRFMVAHVIRFWPEYLLLKNLYETEKYGKLLSGSMHRLSAIPQWSWDNWMADEKRSGLVPYDLHIHDLDFLLFAFGAPKNTVMHRVKRLDQDYVDNLYEYDDFFIHAEAAWYAGRLPFQSGFRFQFERAVVVYADNAMKVYDTEGNVINMTETAGQADGELQLPQSDGYFNEIQYFVQCVEQDKETDIVRPDELRTAIRLLNRM